ncbi:hypothetical protein DSM3645_02603 [Blastopirellula marina DSM 3645]|uniref:Uncharacterized protein n=2 Tax=Blastopirellula marina TaxID=124 RepID=A3ZVI4_9BACT|nr:hypothetical protein DSM3645_02603 [Blastopirellula marina DSM 3645]
MSRAPPDGWRPTTRGSLRTMMTPTEPSPGLIRTIVECGRRRGVEISWLEAREIAQEVLGNTANDNPWPDV